MQKIVSALVILASVSVGWIDALASQSHESPRGNLPSVSDVLPEPLPLDMSDTPSLRAPSKVEAPKVETVEIVVWSSVMICGDFEPLTNDPIQQVRRCEYVR